MSNVMRHVTPGERPSSDAGYLEMMTKVIFMGGLNRQVVEGKWAGFLDAFAQFDVGRVAELTAEEVEQLSENERIIRYGAKLQAVVDNAREMVTIAQEHGSFGQWLRELVAAEGSGAAARAVAKRFKYMSEQSSERYLYAVGEDIGEVGEKIRLKYGTK